MTPNTIRRTATLVTILALLLWASPGRADTDPIPAPPLEPPEGDPYAHRALHLEVLGAGDAPSGNWAVGLAADLGRRFTLAFSVGEDLSGHHLRTALASRIRLLIHGRWALDVSPGLSRADGEEQIEGTGDDGRTAWRIERQWTELYRANIEAAVTFRTRSRLSFRAFAGVGVTMSASMCMYLAGTGGTSYYCDDPALPLNLADKYQYFPYAGLAASLGAVSFGPEPEDWKSTAFARDGYAWQLLTADAAALAAGLTATAVSPGWDSIVYFWIGDTVAAAAVHTVHGRYGRALASGVLRSGLTLLGGLIGIETVTRHESDDSSPYFPFIGAPQGALAGALTAALIDDLLIAGL